MLETKPTNGSVLFVDDEEDIRLANKQLFELEGFDVAVFPSAEKALETLTPDWGGVVVSDVKMPKMDGMEFLTRVRALDEEIPVVLITGHGDVPMAIQAVRNGAYDFLEKPASPEYLVDVVRHAIEKRQLVLESRALRQRLNTGADLAQCLIGQSAEMKQLRQTIANLAGADVDVLITGDTGTGKELTARCLHDLGARSAARFVALNCGALPESLIESELFGHEAGSFTGAEKRRIGKVEYANGGTLFLDEIESMPLHLQIKLLRCLQERVIERLGSNETIPVNIRVLAAAKGDLVDACKKGDFREDLYYRLNVAAVSLSPLKDRPGDVPILFQHFVSDACHRHGRPLPDMGAETRAALDAHDWPGNVREVRNQAERFALGLVGADLGLKGSDGGLSHGDSADSLADRMEQFERQIISHALGENKGQVEKTAAMLGLPRKTLYLRMKKFNLNRKDYA